ncbi:AAA family ATPase [Magnetovirga frankeli]|uniref:KGGVGR-motif variant AAA ATPase n=1 Tax=Magnetovirga frankeli TaxID=947516 RepID=UPI0012933205|nr:AAA family ATPase [gamma proteobacterium SS-5]
MITFDQILPITRDVFETIQKPVLQLDWLIINRDLNGLVRFIVPEHCMSDDAQRAEIEGAYRVLAERIAPHAYPVNVGILYEVTRKEALHGAQAFLLEGFQNVWVVDRLANESTWESIAEVSSGVPRIVFFSIKGGVGRSTALAASAWALARAGKRVLVMDLDLESPGLSSALLPTDRLPEYGITDWLVEDLVNNGHSLLNDIYATSNLTTAGEIYLVPAHGRDPGEYVTKLGRVWMPKVDAQVHHESWSARLNRLVNELEERVRPDLIFIDSRAGIDEVAAACVTDLGAHTVLMFAIQGRQTWTGYRALFAYWQQRSVITKIRDRLQLVAGLVPDDDRRLDYLAALRADAYSLFEETYDEVEPGAVSQWNFDEDDDNAPHTPLSIRWSRGWYGLLSLQQRMVQVDESEIQSVYGELIEFLNRSIMGEWPS